MNHKIRQHITATNGYLRGIKSNDCYSIKIGKMLGGEMSPVTRLNLYHLVSQVLSYNVKGEVVEAGCFRGLTAVFIAEILSHFESGKKLYLYDSFEGLPLPTVEDQQPKLGKGVFAVNESVVIDNFSGLPKPIVCKGWFQDTMPSQLPSQISFAHIDCDFYEPIKLALNSIYSRLAVGGIIAVHDYEHPDFKGVKMAVDEFCDANNVLCHNMNLNTAESWQCYIRKVSKIGML